MEKNTILAIVLSSAVLIISFMIQAMFYTPQPAAQQQTSPVTAVDTVNEFIQETSPPQIEMPVTTETPQSSQTHGGVLSADSQSVLIPLEKVIIDTELITVELTNTGGDMVSWKLKDHLDKNENVDMIFSGAQSSSIQSSSMIPSRAFSIAFGGLDAAPVS